MINVKDSTDQQRQEDQTNTEQNKIIRYLSKDYTQSRPGKSFNKKCNLKIVPRKEHISRYASHGGATHYVGYLIPCASIVAT